MIQIGDFLRKVKSRQNDNFVIQINDFFSSEKPSLIQILLKFSDFTCDKSLAVNAGLIISKFEIFDFFNELTIADRMADFEVMV